MNLISDIELREINLRNLLKNGGFQFIDEQRPWFPYTSGQVGPYYVQSTAVENNGKAYTTAVQSMIRILKLFDDPFDAVSGGETRDWDFSNPVAVNLQMPHIKIYKNGKVLGAGIPGKRILHVADLNNEGSSFRDYWKPIIEKNNGRVIGMLSFVDRMEDGLAVLEELKVPCLSVIPLDKSAWEQARHEGYIPESVFKTIIDRMQNRHAWAERVLLSNPDYFKAMHANPQTRDKTIKIMRSYPGIADKLKRFTGVQ